MSLLRSVAAMGAVSACLALFAAPPAQAEAAPGRIVAIGGPVTEIIYALGAGDRLVARDTTSSYPPEAQALPDIGYMRALSPEGVLSVDPALIIAEESAGPPEALAVLKDAGIPLITVPGDHTAQGAAARILAVGRAIGEETRAGLLAAEVEQGLDAARRKSQARSGAGPKRVMFILSTQNGRILASGTGTEADSMIALAGAENAVTSFAGYKPITDEAVIAAAPDAILMMERSGDHDSAPDDLLALPALSTTPAAAQRAVIRMDGLYLLGFGPRTAQAVADLNAALYGG